MNNRTVNIQSNEYIIRLITIEKIIPTEPYKCLMFAWIITIFFRILILIIDIIFKVQNNNINYTYYRYL